MYHPSELRSRVAVSNLNNHKYLGARTSEIYPFDHGFLKTALWKTRQGFRLFVEVAMSLYLIEVK